MKNNYVARLRHWFVVALLLLAGSFAVNAAEKRSPSDGIKPPVPPVQLQVKVFKSALSTQCYNNGIPLDVMAEELKAAGVEFTCAQRTFDGMAYPAVCGAATGEINVFQIFAADLPTVKRLGYAEVSSLPEYQDRPCEPTKVFKYDGSVQCKNSGIPLDKMARELLRKGIDVSCSHKANDGMMRPAVCGAGTGTINVYQINPENLTDAEALGFHSVNVLPNYQDRQCK